MSPPGYKVPVMKASLSKRQEDLAGGKRVVRKGRKKITTTSPAGAYADWSIAAYTANTMGDKSTEDCSRGHGERTFSKLYTQAQILGNFLIKFINGKEESELLALQLPHANIMM